MKRKVLIALISVTMIGCMSIPVLASNPCSKITTAFKGIIWKYEQLENHYTSGSEVLTYKIFTKDKNGKKVAEASANKQDLLRGGRYKTSSSSSAKKGYYSYNIQKVGTSYSVYNDSNY